LKQNIKNIKLDKEKTKQREKTADRKIFFTNNLGFQNIFKIAPKGNMQLATLMSFRSSDCDSLSTTKSSSDESAGDNESVSESDISMNELENNIRGIRLKSDAKRSHRKLCRTKAHPIYNSTMRHRSCPVSPSATSKTHHIESATQIPKLCHSKSFYSKSNLEDLVVDQSKIMAVMRARLAEETNFSNLLNQTSQKLSNCSTVYESSNETE
jgi:hypothetical protein